MIRLHASYGLKVPAEQEYSSQSFHATAEIELADATAQDPESMRRALHGLWFELKKAVANEINGDPSHNNRLTDNSGSRSAPSNGNGRNHLPGPSGNGRNGRNGNGRGEPKASKKQIGFLLSLFRRHRNMSADQARGWLREDRGVDLYELTKSQAGQLIDQIQE